MKCKNCEKETDNKIYCSLSCRNIYVNKNLRNYKNNSEGLKKMNRYISKKCETCGKELPYEKRRNKYCNHSCSATNTNKNKKGLTYILTIDGKNNLKKSAIKNFKLEKIYKNKIIYYSNKKRCLCCNKIISYRKRLNNFCDRKCKTIFYKDKRTELENYKNECKFSFAINSYPNEFDFNLIEKYGWYKAKNKGDNLTGVSRDHMFSITEGFKNKIDPKLISHPANCKLMIHTNNQLKNSKCSISIEELIERIKDWNIKY